MGATRWPLASLALATAICVGVGFTGGQPNKKKKEDLLPAVLLTPMKPAAGDDEIRKLQLAHYNTLMAYTAYMYRKGGDDLVPASRRLIRLGLDLRDRPQDKIDFSKQWLEWVQKIHARIEQGAKEAGGENVVSATELQWREFAQEIGVEYAKAKKAAKKAEK